jgi:hypothetical protein
LVRRITRVSRGIGAYFRSSSIVAIVRPRRRSSSLSTTLPTSRPAIRTSACSTSSAASSKEALKRYFSGLSGTGPPNFSHRKVSSANTDSAKPAIANS